jgi:hypothetical protein
MRGPIPASARRVVSKDQDDGCMRGKDGRPIRTSLLGLASKMPKPMNRHGSMESVARADPLRRVIGR